MTSGPVERPGQEAIARALDAIAQTLDPIEGEEIQLRIHTDDLQLVNTITFLAAQWNRQLNPELDDLMLASGMRGTANLLREAASIDTQGL